MVLAVANPKYPTFQLRGTQAGAAAVVGGGGFVQTLRESVSPWYALVKPESDWAVWKIRKIGSYPGGWIYAPASWGAAVERGSGGVSGILKRKVVPLSMADSTIISPFKPLRMRFTMASPNPVPGISKSFAFLARKNSVKRCCWSSGEIPMPESETSATI